MTDRSMTAPATPLPCPFCGAGMALVVGYGLNRLTVHVHAVTPIEYDGGYCRLADTVLEPSDIPAWNRRAPPPGQAALVEAHGWRLIKSDPPPNGRVRFLVTSVEADNQDPTNPFPGDPYDGIELMSGPFDHPDGPHFLNHNSGNYCSVKHWTHWRPLPAPPPLDEAALSAVADGADAAGVGS